MGNKIVFIFFVLLVKYSANAQNSQSSWVDSIMQKMTVDEKIGQLFTIRSFARPNDELTAKNMEYIKKYHVGGVCFFQGDPTTLAKINNEYQKISKIPMSVAIDGEWGLGMRFPQTSISFPKALTLGAIQDDNLIYELGKHIADHCKRIGVNINFAPVVDVNNNPNNPVINNRSFGEDKYNVAAKGYQYMKGMQDNGVLANAKHFPGHGDTDTDSHLDLPIINHNRSRLDSIELMPFRALIDQGVGSIMVAHLHIPALDDRKNRPTTLSYNTNTTLLREELGFEGLIFTDGMEMKGVTKHFVPGEADKEAILAGADVILLPENIDSGVKSIKDAVKSGEISMQRLDASVRRILNAKYSLGLTKWHPVDTNGIPLDINNQNALAFKEELIENAITFAADEENILPFRKINDLKFTTIALGSNSKTSFQDRISSYVDAKHYFVPNNTSLANKEKILKQVEGSDYVIVSIHDMNIYASKNFGVDLTNISFLEELKKNHKLIIVLFGSPYALTYFDNFGEVVVAYEEDNMFQDITAQSLFGVFDIKGKLPVTASSKYYYGKGEYKTALGRLGYSIPERVGMSSELLNGIDTIIADMIKAKAAPGGQVLVARKGKIVFHKPYGYFTYDKTHAVTNDDIYDVASVTKVCATTISLMRLYDEEKFDIYSSIDRYLPEADTCNKGDLKIDAVLAHHARLAGWIPFYKKTVSDSRKNPQPLEKYYSKKLLPDYSIPVADNLFLKTEYRDSIWSRIYGSKLKENAGYKYSDLAFYLMHKIIRNITTQPINTYAQESFYRPLGLTKTGYLPLSRHPRSSIAPTENDAYFRRQVIQGHVHDMGAAMLGGVSGHAGLFSNAKELAVLYQMLLNGGYYGGIQYIKPSTIALFTSKYHASTRRGLGFDMKEIDDTKSMNMSKLASENTYGHLGFTGIAAFADPDEELIYIFVTNRTYPDMDNNKFGKREYRPRVQTQIYRALGKGVVIP